MGEVYQMDIAGCKRELPICPLNEHMDIAGFVMFSDVEITEKTAKALLEKCRSTILLSRRNPREFRWPMKWRVSAAEIMWWPVRE